MKKLIYLSIGIFLVLPMILMFFVISEDQIVYSHGRIIEGKNKIAEAGGPGVSNYTIDNYVTYDVEINFTLLNELGSETYNLKFDYLNDKQPNNTLTQYCPEYQESRLLYHNITGYKSGELKQNFNDDFNNTFDEFNATLTAGQRTTYSAKYNITLNAISFNSNPTIGAYDTSDQIFSLYCNKSNQIFNRTDNDLITASNTICSGLTNPIDKAQAIINWVSNNIEYQEQWSDRGASWAYDNLLGDCSEYSSLMVTLLRIQNIPARRVLGFLISNNPTLRPQKGNTWTFRQITNFTGMMGALFTNFKRHAWMEYYVPDIGWIACDPTWHSGAYNYFNKIDYLRFTETIGDWFINQIKNNVSEFCNPGLGYSPPCNFYMEYKVKVTVTETDVLPLPRDDNDGDDDDDDDDDIDIITFLTSPLFLLIVAISVGIVLIIVCILRFKGRGASKDSSTYTPDYT